MSGQATQVSQMLATMQYAEVQAAQNTVNKQTSLAAVQLQFTEAERIYSVDKKLFAQNAIGSQEMALATNNYNSYKMQYELQKEILHQDTISRTQQSDQNKESMARAKASLEIVKRKVEGLTIVAPRDGQLTSLDAEVGQSKTPGFALGQLYVLDGFKVRRSEVDEHYINRVFTGQTATFSLNDTTYKLMIVKVYTQVA